MKKGMKTERIEWKVGKTWSDVIEMQPRARSGENWSLRREGSVSCGAETSRQR